MQQMVKIGLKRSLEDISIIEFFAEDILLGAINHFFIKKMQFSDITFTNIAQAQNWFDLFKIKRIKNYLLFLLSSRNYHSAMLKEKLKQKKVDHKSIQKVLDQISMYLDDFEYEKKIILKEFAKGYGPKLITLKLQQKNIFVDIDEKLISIDMQKTKILEMMNKKFSKNKDIQKILAYFCRRGFDYSLIKEAFSGNR